MMNNYYWKTKVCKKQTFCKSKTQNTKKVSSKHKTTHSDIQIWYIILRHADLVFMYAYHNNKYGMKYKKHKNWSINTYVYKLTLPPKLNAAKGRRLE